MSDWPKLVRDWDDKHPADLAVCEKCSAKYSNWDPGEGDPYDLCVKCTARDGDGLCGGQVVMAYDVGEMCANCDKLDYTMPLQVPRLDAGPYARDVYCSRRCQLQHEYALMIGEPRQ